MASKDEGAGCGCLIILVLLSIGGCKAYRWYASNPDAPGILITTLSCLVLAVVFFFTGRRYWRYRQRIIRWENTELKRWCRSNSVDDFIARSKNLAVSACQGLNEAEKCLTDVEHEMAVFHNDEAKIGE